MEEREEERPCRALRCLVWVRREVTAVFLRMMGPQLASPWAARMEARILLRGHRNSLAGDKDSFSEDLAVKRLRWGQNLSLVWR